jgi:hypothetical protein
MVAAPALRYCAASKHKLTVPMIQLIYVGDPTQFQPLCGSTHAESDGARQPNVDSGLPQSSDMLSLRHSSAPGQRAVSGFRHGCTLQGSARRTPAYKASITSAGHNLYRLLAVCRPLSQSLDHRHSQTPMSAPTAKTVASETGGDSSPPAEILRVPLLQPRRFFPFLGPRPMRQTKTYPSSQSSMPNFYHAKIADP